MHIRVIIVEVFTEIALYAFCQVTFFIFYTVQDLVINKYVKKCQFHNQASNFVTISDFFLKKSLTNTKMKS